jgi:hypothetical protein
MLGLRHGLELAIGNMPRQMIHTARTGYEHLLRRKPAVFLNPVSNCFSRLHIKILNVGCPDCEKLIAKKSLVFGCLVVFNM